MFRAIQRYRRQHHRLPERLDDMVPLGIIRADSLLCPSASVSGENRANKVITDKPAPYLYEFEQRPLTNELARNFGLTLRSLRQWQMGRIGSEVPLVRCTNHPSPLNLSFGGAIYESGLEWEAHFASKVRSEDLSLEKLLSENMRLDVLRISTREPGTPRELIDLTEYYNGALNGWLESRPEDNLAGVRPGRTNIAGCTFDVRGVIQLASRAYSILHRPAAISNIMVGLRCQSLVFLHGTVDQEFAGLVIGQYVLHFEDGSTDVFALRYGEQLLEWRADPLKHGKLNENSSSWNVLSAAGSNQKKTVHLHTTRWRNLHSDLRIERIDFLSSTTLSAPFLIAITAEPVDANASKDKQSE